MSEEDLEKYFFNVTIDPETRKPSVMKMLKPPTPIIETVKSDTNPDGPPEIRIKQPEISPEM